MKGRIITIAIALSLVSVIAAQAQQVTNSLKFESGVYLTYQSFKSNTPDYTWEDARASAYVNDERYLAQVEYIKLMDSTTNEFVKHPIQNFWGICVNGVPYVRVFNPYKQMLQFAGLRTRGKLCYFTLEGFIVHKIPMTVYDPFTGKALGSKDIENREDVLIRHLLRCDTGEMRVFTVDNFKYCINDDEALLETVGKMTAEELKDKLY